MVKLYDKGVYLINGTEIAESSEEVKAKTGQDWSEGEAAKQTIGYRILKEHNTSGNMDKIGRAHV